MNCFQSLKILDLTARGYCANFCGQLLRARHHAIAQTGIQREKKKKHRRCVAAALCSSHSQRNLYYLTMSGPISATSRRLVATLTHRAEVDWYVYDNRNDKPML